MKANMGSTQMPVPVLFVARKGKGRKKRRDLVAKLNVLSAGICL